MTQEELKKIPFRFVSPLSMVDEHVVRYSDDSGRLGFCVITPKKDDLTFGKSKTRYRIDNKIFKTKEKFLEALENFGFKVVSIKF